MNDSDLWTDALTAVLGARPRRKLWWWEVRAFQHGRRQAFWAALDVLHAAEAGEAGTAETTEIGSVHEHAVGLPMRPNSPETLEE